MMKDIIIRKGDVRCSPTKYFYLVVDVLYNAKFNDNIKVMMLADYQAPHFPHGSVACFSRAQCENDELILNLTKVCDEV